VAKNRDGISPGMCFGDLTVEERYVPPNNENLGGSRWHCRCACGTSLVVTSYALRKQGRSSCGCKTRERQILPTQTADGLSGHPMYRRWANMISRCHYPSDALYVYYGGRGITVCERWHSLKTFIEDMGPCPDGHSLERVDNSRGYSPDNCRWATAAEQAANRRHPVPNWVHEDALKELEMWKARAISLGWEGSA
jgi:hypothetical protein